MARKVGRRGRVVFCWFMILPCGAVARQRADASADCVIETGRIRLSVRRSAPVRVQSIRQLPSGRQLLAADAQSPLFRVHLTDSTGTARTVESHEAKQFVVKKIDGGWQFDFRRFPAADVGITATVHTARSADGVAFRLEARLPEGWSVDRVEYPLIVAKLPLSGEGGEDTVLFPRHEGVLLREPVRNLRRVGQADQVVYPGKAAFQFMAYYDSGGGLYLGTHDNQGYAKAFRVRRDAQGLELAVIHLGQDSAAGRWTRPYPVVVSSFRGDWTCAADLYRAWARRQPWSRRRIAERDVPAWLRAGVAFFNCNLRNPPFAPDKIRDALAKLSQDLQLPVVATLGAASFRDLAASLHARGDRLFVYLSGFRWALAKPGTRFDGRGDFERRGRKLAALDASAQPLIERRPWAENARLCVGCEGARDLLAECFRRAFALGADGVQLDQDLGAEAAVCYSRAHDHPPGPGRWQYEAMAAFLSRVRREAKTTDPDRILSVEEPCELFIPYLDVYHGRAFTYRHWPVYGPGAIGAPVFLYLYHPYLLGYAGWTGGGFDVGNRTELSIGRAFIYGMLLGVRSGVWRSSLRSDGNRTAFDMWRRAVRVQRRCAAALLLGDMGHPPRLRGVVVEHLAGRKDRKGRQLPPVSIPSVQATAWRTGEGAVWYALANVTGAPQTISIEVGAGAGCPERADIVRVGPERQDIVRRNVRLPSWVALRLEPYEVLCLELRACSADSAARTRPAATRGSE